MGEVIVKKRVLVLTAVLLATLFVRSEATQLGDGGKSRVNVVLSQPLTLRWRYNSNLTLNLTPAFDEENVYLPLAGGIIVSLKARNGELNWRSEMGGELSASPVADEERVYVACETVETETVQASPRPAKGTIRALGREGGVTQWMRTLPMPLQGSLSLGNGLLFGGGSDGTLYAFDSTTGELKWSFKYSAAFNCQPVLSSTHLYAGSEDGSLLAFEEHTGRMLWRYRSKGPVRGPVAVANETVYFGSGDGYLYAVRSSNGKLLWRNRTGAGVQSVARVGDSLLVASLDNFVYLFSLNGARIWKRQLPGRVSAQPLTATDGALYTPLSSAAGVVLGLHDGRPVNSLPTGEEITTSASPIAVGEAIMVTTEHGLLAFAQPGDKAAVINQ